MSFWTLLSLHLSLTIASPRQAKFDGILSLSFFLLFFRLCHFFSCHFNINTKNDGREEWLRKKVNNETLFCGECPTNSFLFHHANMNRCSINEVLVWEKRAGGRSSVAFNQVGGGKKIDEKFINGFHRRSIFSLSHFYVHLSRRAPLGLHD